MSLFAYKELLSVAREIGVSQIMLKLEMKLLRHNEQLTDDQKKAIEEAEREIIKLIKMTTK